MSSTKLVRAPFEPVGAQARWKTVYDLLVQTPIGGVVSYAEMADALGLHPNGDRSLLQQAMQRAGKEYLTQDNRAVEAIANVGYRVVQPEEHMGLAHKHQRKASRSLKRGLARVSHVDMTGLDPEVQKGFGIVARAFEYQLDFNRRMDVRHKKLENSVKQMEDKTERNIDEVAELRSRLEKLEAGMK